jgi:hypothetical protein
MSCAFQAEIAASTKTAPVQRHHRTAKYLQSHLLTRLLLLLCMQGHVQKSVPVLLDTNAALEAAASDLQVRTVQQCILYARYVAAVPGCVRLPGFYAFDLCNQHHSTYRTDLNL